MQPQSRLLLAVGLALLSGAALAQGPDIPQGAPQAPLRGDPAPALAPSTPSTPPTPSPGGPSAAQLESARAGNVNAQLDVGIAYLAAKPANFQEAMRWFRQAADLGSASAAHNIGEMHAAGIGVPRNLVEAATWYRLGATRGSPQAQTALGRLHESGQGVTQDYAEALRWFRAAADQNFPAGQNHLGAMYSNGRGVPADHVEATRLYRLAANRGDPLAQGNLGIQYLNGRGVAQNLAAAYFWLNLSAARLPANQTQARTQAAAARDAAARRLAAADLEQMQRLAKDWKPGSTNVPGESTPVAAAAGRPPGAGTPAAARPPGAVTPSGSGTGFVVGASGVVLTNNHVINQCREVRARHGTTPLGAVTVVATDTQNDLALLKLPARFPDVAVFREDRGVRQGDAVVVYGFPLAGGLAAQGNLTTGTISALAGLGNDSRLLQLSAPVQPGNSGGPLLDAGGNVLGVVTGQLNALKIAATSGSVPQNVNFAIKASVARNFLDANGVDYRTAALTQELKPADVGDRAKTFTLLIECLR